MDKKEKDTKSEEVKPAKFYNFMKKKDTSASKASFKSEEKKPTNSNEPKVYNFQKKKNVEVKKESSNEDVTPIKEEKKDTPIYNFQKKKAEPKVEEKKEEKIDDSLKEPVKSTEEVKPIKVEDNAGSEKAPVIDREEEIKNQKEDKKFEPIMEGDKELPIVVEDEEKVYPKGEIGELYKECDEYNSPEAVKARKSKSVWKGIGDVFFILILGVICYGIIIVNLAKQQGNVPFLFGYSLEYVETGSMEPTLPTGSVIIAKQIDDTTSINVGDIITFYQGYDRTTITETPTNRTVVTHRVYAETKDVNGTKWYTTKGDNNATPDQYDILFSDIIATFVRRVF